MSSQNIESDNKQIQNKNNNPSQQQKEQQAQQIAEHTIATTDDNKAYNVAILEQIKVFNKINQNIIDNAINNTRTIHELLTEYIEIFNKSIELGQQCYRDGIKNYFNFGKKI